MANIKNFIKVILCIGFVVQILNAGILRDFITENESEEKDAIINQDVRLLSNISYGNQNKEKFDVYLPIHTTTNAPIIFMVHGGAWMFGDKKNQSVVENKVNYWVKERGYILVSINYPMLSSTPVSNQLTEVAKALGVIQSKCASWGGDKNRVILMGHSAGAHLIAMIASSSSLYSQYGIIQPIAAIFLDSAVMDTPTLMNEKHLRLYDRAFGDNKEYWQSLSPLHQLTNKRMPLLAVCSTKRDEACPQSKSFLDKAKSFGTQTLLVPEAMSHKDINLLLGKEPTYSKIIDDFLKSVLK
ncbi:MAG: alpha/beta hydrolase [Aliarcobacter sp.]|nr:alpha/beta hydrolase [Aliarcobacter sp.]